MNIHVLEMASREHVPINWTNAVTLHHLEKAIHEIVARRHPIPVLLLYLLTIN